LEERLQGYAIRQEEDDMGEIYVIHFNADVVGTKTRANFQKMVPENLRPYIWAEIEKKGVLVLSPTKDHPSLSEGELLDTAAEGVYDALFEECGEDAVPD
jgi:hypothetical protein